MKDIKQRRTTSIRVRLTQNELAQIKAKADSFDLSMSDYVRLLAIREKAGRPKNSGRFTRRIAKNLRFRVIAEKPIPTGSDN